MLAPPNRQHVCGIRTTCLPATDIGSTPTHLLVRVLREGAAIGVGGIVAGAIGGVLLSRIVGSFVPDLQMPGLAPIAGAAFVLIVAAIVASLTPAARASRVDVICALRSE